MSSLPRAVHALIGLLLIAATAALVAWQVIPFWQQTQQGWIPDIRVKTVANTNTLRTHDVSRFSLFGAVNQAAPVPEETPEELPETRLRLTLTGILAGRQDNSAGALIEGPDRQTQYYKIGDELPGNATLHKVFPERVVVERSGRLENLYFPESAAPMQAIQDYRDAPANQNLDNKPEPAAIPERNPNVLSEERRQSIKDRLSNLRQRIMNNRN